MLRILSANSNPVAVAPLSVFYQFRNGNADNKVNPIRQPPKSQVCVHGRTQPRLLMNSQVKAH